MCTSKLDNPEASPAKVCTLYRTVDLSIISAGGPVCFGHKAMSESNRNKRGIVLFDTKFGNTEKIAKSLANGLERAGLRADCVNIKDVQVDTLGKYDIIAVGAPTQAFTASKPMKDFLGKLRETEPLKGKRGFAFDTKFNSPLSGSAARYIEKRLENLGIEIVKPRQSAIVKKSEGPLEEGAEQEFERIGLEVGKIDRQGKETMSPQAE